MRNRHSAPAATAALYDHALSLVSQGRREEARKVYEKVLRRDPRHFLTLITVASHRRDAGAFGDSLKLLSKAAVAQPRNPAVYFARGLTFIAMGRLADALAELDRVTNLSPAWATAHSVRREILVDMDEPEEALRAFDAVGRICWTILADYNPRRGALLTERVDLSMACFGCVPPPPNENDDFDEALGLFFLGRFEESLVSYERMIEAGPSDAMAHANKAAVLINMNRFEKAILSCETAISLQPACETAYEIKSKCLAYLGQFNKALICYRKLLGVNKNNIAANLGIANILLRAGHLQEALPYFDKAAMLEPSAFVGMPNKAASLLNAGYFEEGWSSFERRSVTAPPLRNVAQWRGQADLSGKRLLVYWEQGFGDVIQFSRYVRILSENNVDVTLLVQSPLRSLLQQLTPATPVLDETELRGRVFDYQCPLLSLPFALRSSVKSIPSWPSYIEADRTRCAEVESFLGPKKRLRVGLAWSGNPIHLNDHNRSMALNQMAPLLSSDVEWCALQKEIQPRDTADMQVHDVRDLREHITDFGDTAAIVQAMDLVITVDTSVAHLAGAMGKPVWILLPTSSDWRWMLNRTDTPWYPSARLLRQQRPRDWLHVIDEVAGELRNVIASPSIRKPDILTGTGPSGRKAENGALPAR